MTIRIPDSALKEIAHLRTRVEELESKLHFFHEDSDQRSRAIKMRHPSMPLGLARILASLSYGGILSRERMLTLSCRPAETDERSVDSHMKRIRAKGQIKFVAHYGIGYALSDESLALVRGILRRQQ